MLSGSPIENDSVLRDLAQISIKALKDLEISKKQLQENDLQMQEANRMANERVNEITKVNHNLQEQISYVENMTKTIQEKNANLENAVREVIVEKSTYRRLNEQLKTDLGNVIKKEKELSVKQIFLERKIQEQSGALMRTEKMAMIGQLTSRLAQDLRNPLTKIKLAHEILCQAQKMQVMEKIKNQQRINDGVSNMVHIIEDVLEFVRMSELDLRKHTLKNILDTSISKLEVPSTVNLTIEGNDMVVLCDDRKIEVVFGNILKNALEAIKGQGYVSVKILSNASNVEIYFEDSGEGVGPIVQSKMFEPMFSTKQNGNGLGLAICKMIVEQHGGRLDYKNHPSAFSVILPKNIGQKILAR